MPILTGGFKIDAIENWQINELTIGGQNGNNTK